MTTQTSILKLFVLGVLVVLSQTAFADTNCSVSTYNDTYYGSGYDRGSALADARNQCIRAENNSYVCMNASFDCDDRYDPRPPTRMSSCMVTFRGRSYTGEGYDVNQALASARDECIRSEGNSRVCLSAPFSCRQ